MANNENFAESRAHPLNPGLPGRPTSGSTENYPTYKTPEPTPKGTEPRNISRRSFLKLALYGGAVAAGGGVVAEVANVLGAFGSKGPRETSTTVAQGGAVGESTTSTAPSTTTSTAAATTTTVAETTSTIKEVTWNDLISKDKTFEDVKNSTDPIPVTRSLEGPDKTVSSNEEDQFSFVLSGYQLLHKGSHNRGTFGSREEMMKNELNDVLTTVGGFHLPLAFIDGYGGFDLLSNPKGNPYSLRVAFEFQDIIEGPVTVIHGIDPLNNNQDIYAQLDPDSLVTCFNFNKPPFDYGITSDSDLNVNRSRHMLKNLDKDTLAKLFFIPGDTMQVFAKLDHNGTPTVNKYGLEEVDRIGNFRFAGADKLMSTMGWK